MICPITLMKKASLISQMASLMNNSQIQPMEEEEMDVIMEVVSTMEGTYVEENGSGSDQEGESSSKDDGKGQDKEMVKEDTKAKAQQLYKLWSILIPTLTVSLFTYISKSTGKPTCATFDTSMCQTCDHSHHSSKSIICLFWDHKHYSPFSNSHSHRSPCRSGSH